MAHRKSFLKQKDAWITVLVIDLLAIPLTKALNRIGFVEPNHVTVMSVLLFFGGIGMLFIDLRAAAVAAIVASIVFDCVDGKLARLRGGGDLFGAMADAIADLVMHSFGFLAIAVWLMVEGHVFASGLLFMWASYLSIAHVSFIKKAQLRARSVTVPTAASPNKWRAWCAKNRLESVPVSEVEIAFCVVPLCIAFSSYSDIILGLSTVVAAIGMIWSRRHSHS